MNKLTNKLSPLTLLLTSYLLFSCDQIEVQPSSQINNHHISNVKVIDGALHFTNPESFVKNLDSILALNETSLDQWESEFGLKSLRTHFSIVNDEFRDI